jgi:two-component SAPR family response regulator
MDHIAELQEKKAKANLVIHTMGDFKVVLDGRPLVPKDWGREKSIQLIQFLITARDRHALHKEQIATRIWDDVDDIDRDFKVALHGVSKALEPNRKRGEESTFIRRNGQSYQLILDQIWLDVEAFDQAIKLSNTCKDSEPELAVEALRYAVDLYQGTYLPNRIYEDWTSMERERLQLLGINAMIALGEYSLSTNPNESLRLAQSVLQIDHVWEEAYRLQMKAYQSKQNRPQAIKTYRQCEKVLEEEFGILPLPETRKLLENIMAT